MSQQSQSSSHVMDVESHDPGPPEVEERKAEEQDPYSAMTMTERFYTSKYHRELHTLRERVRTVQRRIRKNVYPPGAKTQQM